MNFLSSKVYIWWFYLTAVDLTQGQRRAAAPDGSAFAEKQVCSHCQHWRYCELSGCINGIQCSTDARTVAIMLLIK